jgi:hypothetical protein
MTARFMIKAGFTWLALAAVWLWLPERYPFAVFRWIGEHVTIRGFEAGWALFVASIFFYFAWRNWRVPR